MDDYGFQGKELTSIENYDVYRNLSQNLCSFISSVYQANTFDEHTIRLLADNSNKVYFSNSLSTKAESCSILSGNWDLNENQTTAISNIITTIIDNDFNCEQSNLQCSNIISSIPESDQGLVLLFYLTTQQFLDNFETLFPSTRGGFWDEFWVSLVANIPPTIWGAAIGAGIGGEIGGPVGAVIGLVGGTAAGVAILHYANTVVVHGIVVDETGDPIPGVTILATGTSNGTITDVDGIFSLRVPIGSKVVVSLVGYKTEVLDTNKPSVKVITLEEDI